MRRGLYRRRFGERRCQDRWRRRARGHWRRSRGVHCRNCNPWRISGLGGRNCRNRFRHSRPRDRGNRRRCGGRRCRSGGAGGRSWMCGGGLRGHCRSRRRQIRQCRAGLRPEGVLRLRGGCSRSTSAQLFPRRLASPGSRIDLPNHTQPLLGFGKRGEVTHVQPEALAPFFEATTHKKGEAFQLGQVDLRERHRRRRRAEIQNERARLGFRRRRFPGFGTPRCAGSQIWRW